MTSLTIVEQRKNAAQIHHPKLRTPSVSRTRAAYEKRVTQLSSRSVTKHFDAYADIDWEAADHRIDPDDPRWEKDTDDVLGRTSWYRNQPSKVRSRIGLHHIVAQMKTGIEFEAVLSRGLLEFAGALPNGAPEFRYAYHELIEEGQHSLMFQEFVNRAGLPVRGLSGLEAFGARFVPRLGRTFPELFFLFVLGGEAPIDHVQRRALANTNLHPLLRRVMQIHVTEEARHLSFARSFLLEHVKRLGRFRRWQLRLRAPFILATMAQQMLRPPRHLIQTYGIPREVVQEAYSRNPRHAQQTFDSLKRVRSLCEEIGLIEDRYRPLWQALGIASGPTREPPSLPPARRGEPVRLVPGIIRAVPDEWLQRVSS